MYKSINFNCSEYVSDFTYFTFSYLKLAGFCFKYECKTKLMQHRKWRLKDM